MFPGKWAGGPFQNKHAGPLVYFPLAMVRRFTRVNTFYRRFPKAFLKDLSVEYSDWKYFGVGAKIHQFSWNFHDFPWIWWISLQNHHFAEAREGTKKWPKIDPKTGPILGSNNWSKSVGNHCIPCVFGSAGPRNGPQKWLKCVPKWLKMTQEMRKPLFSWG